MTDFGGKTSIFSHPVYLFLRKFSLQDSRGGSLNSKIRLLRIKAKGYRNRERFKLGVMFHYGKLNMAF
ncbi:hypothetical protein D4716_24445 [Shigella boydii]|nr:hypothetical protein [Shigella boydii]